jgi:Tfp pilus assembly protein PilN
MKKTNLLPKEQQREIHLLFFSEKLQTFWLWVGCSLLVFLILTLLAKVFLTRQLGEISRQIEDQRRVLKSSDNELLKQEVSNLNNQMASIKHLNSGHYYWSNALVELGNLFAPDIQIDLITMDRATGQVDIKGTAGSRESVLRFWSDIHKSPYFMNINFPLTNLERATNSSFAFTFFINPQELLKP